jgi:hypothetical protein
MNIHNATQFASEWINAWNSHDVNRILSLYAQEIEYHSVFIEQLMLDKEGKIDNRSDLKIYFSLALSKYPNLYFQFFDVLTGVDSVIIFYRSVNQKIAAEYMQFNQKGKINFVRAHYDSTNKVANLMQVF